MRASACILLAAAAAGGATAVAAGAKPTGRARAVRAYRMRLRASRIDGRFTPRERASFAIRRAHAPFKRGIVLVGLRADTDLRMRRAILRRAGVRWSRPIGAGAVRPTRADRRLERRLGLTFTLGVRSGRELAVVALLRRQRRWVRFAEPDYLMRASAVSAATGVTNVPADPAFGLQWASHNTGQTVNGITGVAGADDGAARAWSVATGSRSIVVGEVDTGVDYNHPDLASNIWTNPGGIGGCAAGTHGYNVAYGGCNPLDDDAYYGGHGSHVAGIIGAVADNGIGVAGINWSTTILPVKWLDSNAWGSTSQLISALDWVLQAKQAGVNVRVVNDSATFYGTAYSQALSDEIDLLGANNILFVTAAGNTGQDDDNPQYTRYPCAYDRPNEICVTATNQSDQLPAYANWGANTVDLAAPGDNIYSTLRNGGYGYISGGSMAAAAVSGAAALILSADDMSATALKADILGSVDPLPSLSGLVRTGGRLDVCRAIPACADQSPPPPPPPPSPPVNGSLPIVSGTAAVGQTLTASTGSWSPAPTAYAYAWERCDATGGSCTTISGETGSSYPVQKADAGATLRVTVTASDAGGPSNPATSSPTAVVTSPPATATLGTTAIGGSSDTFWADRERVNNYSLPAAGSVTKLSVYLAPTSVSGQQDLKGLIYQDSGGSPGALLATTTQLAFSSTDTAGWYDLTFPTPVALPAGTYWIGIFSGATGSVAGFRYNTAAGSRDISVQSYASGPSNPFGTFTNDNEQMSLYATYTTG